MKLKDQCCTLEQAKRLNELGVSQDSYFLVNSKGEILEQWAVEGTEDVFCSAFTVAELGEMLTGKFKYCDNECFIDSVKYSKDHRWISGIHTVWAHDKPVVAKKYFPGQTEAEVRAALLIYLIEKNYQTIEEINKRLSESKEGER